LCSTPVQCLGAGLISRIDGHVPKDVHARKFETGEDFQQEDGHGNGKFDGRRSPASSSAGDSPVTMHERFSTDRFDTAERVVLLAAVIRSARRASSRQFPGKYAPVPFICSATYDPNSA